MPEKRTKERARKARRQGKKPSTQAGEYVREEMRHVKRGKHGARSRQQTVAIGLSKARRSGVKLGAPKKGQAKESTRRSAQQARRRAGKPVSRRRSRATLGALKREGRPRLTRKRTAGRS